MNFLNDDFSSVAETKGKPTVEEFRNRYLSTLAERSTSSYIRQTDQVSISKSSREDTTLLNDTCAILKCVGEESGKAGILGTLFWNTVVLAERTGKNYSRNLLAYGIRMGMYGGASRAALVMRLGAADMPAKSS
jgi:hypothetical protein